MDSSCRSCVRSRQDELLQNIWNGPYTCLLFLSRSPVAEFRYSLAKADPASGFTTVTELSIASCRLSPSPWVFVAESAATLLDRLRSLPQLSHYCEIKHGLQTGFDSVFLLDYRRPGSSPETLKVVSDCEPAGFEIERGAVRKVVKGLVDIKRYQIVNDRRYVVFPYATADGVAAAMPQATLKSQFPLAWNYLNRHAPELKKKKKPGEWYNYRRRNYDLLDNVPRLLVPSIGLRASFVLDPQGDYHFVGSGGGGGGGYGLFLRNTVQESPYYLLAVLNSTLLDWIIKRCNSRFGHGYYSFNRQYIEPLPIRPIDFNNNADQSRHHSLVDLAKDIIALYERHAKAKTPQSQTALGRQIAATDAQIDAVVYDLYGLTHAEIQTVEASIASSQPPHETPEEDEPPSDL